MSCSTSIGRRSPGRRIAQPPWRASQTHSDAAARTALSSASSLAGRRRVEHDQRGGVELGDQPPLEHLAAAGHRRPVDARGGRALAVRSQPVDLELGGRRVEPPARQPGLGAAAAAVASARPRCRPARSPARCAAGRAPPPRLRRPARARTVRSGSRITSRPGSRIRRPRREKRTLIRSRRDQRPAIGTGQPSSGSSSSPPGGGSLPVSHLHAQRVRARPPRPCAAPAGA